jgi:hypothetical protein
MLSAHINFTDVRQARSGKVAVAGCQVFQMDVATLFDFFIGEIDFKYM